MDLCPSTSATSGYTEVRERVCSSAAEKESVMGVDEQLKVVLLKNQRMFLRESPYLDALLVYVSLL